MSPAIANTAILSELQETFGAASVVTQETRDGIPTFWAPRDKIYDIVRHLKSSVSDPYKMLYDLTAIDERTRLHREGEPPGDFSVVYHLFSFERNEYIRIKIALKSDDLHIKTITGVWPCANWYEREVWDMFGIVFDGHPHLARILMPRTWVGHPLRKDHPARATEMGPFRLPDEKQDEEQEALRFKPEEWGMQRASEDTDFIFLNVGPQHPGTHGVLRIVLQLDG
ncbi:MAG: NADH-quinone oxidoreductase subunit C, partial [Terriglobia bacterium]